MTTPAAAPSGDEPADTHFEVALDDEPEPRREPVYVDAVVREHTRQPIIPANLRGAANIKATLRREAGLAAHRFAYHAAHSPRYLFWTLVWSVVGVFRVTGWQLRWWWVADAVALEQHAASRNDPDAWHKVHREAKDTRGRRGLILVTELVVIVVSVALLYLVAPWWMTALTITILVPMLAKAGRPADKRILTPAVVAPRWRKLNSDIVLRAYYAAGLGNPNKPDQQIDFLSGMSDVEGKGSQVRVALPYGKTFAEAVKARHAIASGLDVSEYQVFLTGDKTSNRSHWLYVAYEDPLAIPAGPALLLDRKPRDIWKPVRFGLDERGRRVEVPLMWHSVLVGAQPRKGKTFSARLLALHAALDPWVKLFIADGKNSPDWRKFALVADVMIYGTHPNRDGDPVELLRSTLREIKRHIQRVNEILSSLPADKCPEGKLTPELARDPAYPDLRVWMLVMEEFQVYYELDDKEANLEVASLLSFIMAVGPSSGVIIVSSSQKPSGIGAGQQITQLFTRYRDNHAIRFALKCGNRNVSEAILGGDAYSEGFDASGLPSGPEYRGVGYLYGLSDETPTVRTHYADGQDAEVILLAARRHREDAGTLSGMAAGEEVARQVRDVLRDAHGVFYAGEAWVSWQALADRMATRMPEHYAGLTPAAISAQVRALGAEPKKGRDEEGKSVWGVPRERVEQAIRRREVEASK